MSTYMMEALNKAKTKLKSHDLEWLVKQHDSKIEENSSFAEIVIEGISLFDHETAWYGEDWLVGKSGETLCIKCKDALYDLHGERPEEKQWEKMRKINSQKPPEES